ncbi:MAG: DUF1275 family protein, partial [bacterium]|nr:DUF1275 family protein [bacterium]
KTPTPAWKILDDRKFFVLLGTILSFIAGSLNGIATNALVFERISHLSGRVNNMFRDLIFSPAQGLLVVGIVYTFVLGSILGAKALPRLGLTKSLLVPVIPLLIVALLLFLLGAPNITKATYPIERYLAAVLMALAMGIQNSITTQTKLGRTTHFTGDLTDMGIAISNADWQQSSYIFCKHLGFASGGLMGYLSVQSFHPYVGIATFACLLGIVVLSADTISRRVGARVPIIS